jgi:hypothetical protein
VEVESGILIYFPHIPYVASKNDYNLGDSQYLYKGKTPKFWPRFPDVILSNIRSVTKKHLFLLNEIYKNGGYFHYGGSELHSKIIRIYFSRFFSIFAALLIHGRLKNRKFSLIGNYKISFFF